MSYDPNAPSNPSYPPPPQNYGDGANSGNQPYGQQGYSDAPAYSGDGPGYGGAPAPGQQNTLALVSMILGIVCSAITLVISVISVIAVGAVVANN